jgi:multidrug efflux system membrane fusion protein
MSLPSLLRLAVAASAIFAGCKPADTTAAGPVAPRAVNIRVASVNYSTDVPLIRAPGILARQTEADLSFPLPGLLTSVAVRAGERVKAGQELARLQLDPVEAQLNQANAAVEKIKRDLARVEKLQAERVATLENLQDTRTALAQAEAARSAAEFNRRHSVINAPSDGIILRRTAEPNEIVAAGRPIVSFASEGEGWIAKANLAPRDASRIAVGAKASIDDYNGGKLSGQIIRISAAVDSLTRTVPVDVQLDSPPVTAHSGQIVSMWIKPSLVPARSTVPLTALRDGNGGKAFVFILEAGATVAKRISVEIEQIDRDRAYLRTPLPANVQVVVSGGQYLNDGTSVNITK